MRIMARGLLALGRHLAIFIDSIEDASILVALMLFFFFFKICDRKDLNRSVAQERKELGRIF